MPLQLDVILSRQSYLYSLILHNWACRPLHTPHLPRHVKGGHRWSLKPSPTQISRRRPLTTLYRSKLLRPPPQIAARARPTSSSSFGATASKGCSVTSRWPRGRGGARSGWNLLERLWKALFPVLDLDLEGSVMISYPPPPPPGVAGPVLRPPAGGADARGCRPVSYTHLTLPTIYSV